MADQKQLANLEIRGVTPARDLSSLLQLSINLASAIQILDARTKQLDKNLKALINEIKSQSENQMSGTSNATTTKTIVTSGSNGSDGDDALALEIGSSISQILEINGNVLDAKSPTGSEDAIYIPVMDTSVNEGGDFNAYVTWRMGVALPDSIYTPEE